MSKYVVYFRVSTQRQGQSGLGLEAQKRDVNLYLKNYCEDYTIIGEFTDIESGANASRCNYQKAIKLAEKEDAILLVAKLDRASRDVEEIARLIKTVDLKVACMPFADKFQLHLYAALAEQEREFISKRTKAALQSAKERGTKLGRSTTIDELTNMGHKAGKVMKAKANQFAEKLRVILVSMRDAGSSLRVIAQALNAQGFLTQRGKEWTPAGVRNVLIRLSEKSLNPN
ncbi:Transposon Tn3 resolvase [Vibrio campbellii]|uniref:recombinase family protein n=1 Tax=Vibrio campbellii TaxID=680 RepID=UPI00097FB763|nr:recombinase family protein [Vibrio campbellii]AQM71156.1 Transposon Tn3 resolvase [Vibrio campbellii]